MNIIKHLILSIILFITVSSFSQSIIKYECYSAVKYTISNDETMDGGSIEDFIKTILD